MIKLDLGPNGGPFRPPNSSSDRLQQRCGARSEDQTGFIKGRNSIDNVCGLVNNIDFSTIEEAGNHPIPLLDAEKAFDRIDWKSLPTHMHTFGLGE